MKTISICSFVVRRCAWMALALSLVQSGFCAGGVEQTFPVLKTRTATYTNVTVTTKAKTYVFILHSTGMANIKVQDLPAEIQQELGYASAADKQTKTTGPIGKLTGHTMPAITRTLKPLENSWRQTLRANESRFHISAAAAYEILGAALLVYLFFCYCCQLICIKAKSPTSFLIWVPGLQMIPLLRAAGMSRWWFLGLCVPVLNLVISVMWSLNIVKAREKDFWVAIALIIPGVSLFAFLYLAFSSSALKLEPVRYKSMALQTA